MAGSDIIYQLADHNIGALSVVEKLDYSQLVKLQKTKLRGSDIWVAYKDICHEDPIAFRERIDNDIDSLVTEALNKAWEE